MERALGDWVKHWLYDPTVGKLIAAVVAVVLARALGGLVVRTVVRRLKDPTGRYRLRKLVLLTSYAIAAVAVTVIFSNKLGGLTVAFGVAGAGVAFALQEVIASVAGWVAVMFGGFYSAGDRVQLGGIRGDVIDIGVLRTTLMEIGEWVKADIYSGRIVRIANSFVFKEPVFNYSADFPFLWDEITVPVKYGSDYKKARQILEQIAEEEVSEFARGAAQHWKNMVGKFAIEDCRVDPMVTLVANDNWVEFTLRYVVDPKRRRLTKDVLFTRILAAFEAAGSGVAIASMTVHLVQTPTIDVRLMQNKSAA
jgi:small-conductance mechanosensitive channel